MWATAYRDVTEGRSLIRADQEMTRNPQPAREEAFVLGGGCGLDAALARNKRPSEIKARRLAASVLPVGVHDDIDRGRYDAQAGQALKLAGYRLDRSTYLRVWRQNDASEENHRKSLLLGSPKGSLAGAYDAYDASIGTYTYLSFLVTRYPGFSE